MRPRIVGSVESCIKLFAVLVKLSAATPIGARAAANPIGGEPRLPDDPPPFAMETHGLC